MVRKVARFQFRKAAAKVCGLMLCGSSVFAMTAITMALQRDQGKNAGARSESFGLQIPLGISRTFWRRRIPTDNPMTRAKVLLGQVLFFDKRLSADGTVSCANCHDPANAFTDHSVVAIGASKKVGTRNAPTILNAMFSERLFWDGRVGSLEEQAKQPMSNPFEMGMGNNKAVVARIRALPEYRQGFQRVFRHKGITIDTIVKAIAAYERTQLSGNSAFDRFISGETNAMTQAQRRGWELFKGKAKCIECHSFSSASPFFTDFKFHNTGIGANDQTFELLSRHANEIILNAPNLMTDPHTLARKGELSGLGRFLVTKQSEDIAAFKTPSLRDIELTGPYMHDGTLKTLLDIVRFYNQGGQKNPNLDEKMRPLNLTDEEMSDIVEFLRALTSDDILRQTQSLKPQTRIAVTVSPLDSQKGKTLTDPQ
jgi:cytochrome c peroxidase